MKKHNVKGFASGFVTALLIVCLAGTALAYQKQATLNYTGVKIVLDGETVTPTNAQGNAVEPFIMDGTTYLPVRGIASALGLDVAWDQKTQTVTLKSGDVQQPSGESNTGKVIMEKNGIKITFLGFEKRPEGFKGYEIKLKIENSSNTNYTIQCNDLSVNGLMADSIFSCDVAAGKSAVDFIWVYNMEERGISEPITTAEFVFHIFEDGNWNNRFDSNTITVTK